ncbi:MAG: adenylosuccinate synthase [Patescibacteria group bacterium]
MRLTNIIDLAWGDNGKGKDTLFWTIFLSAVAVARYSGGNNAGHAFTDDDGVEHRLSVLTAGIAVDGVKVVLGNGMVISPEKTMEEIRRYMAYGKDVSPDRILLSHEAHIIHPGHRAIDEMMEALRSKGGCAIGTTKNGIGPVYAAKALRVGIRAEQMLDPKGFGMAAAEMADEANQLLQMHDRPLLNAEEIGRAYTKYAELLRPYVTDTSRYLVGLPEDADVIGEASQGTLLDVDHGTYPFVTSCNCTIGAAFSGLGIGPEHLYRNIGLVKAYYTRVGGGPFPTEIPPGPTLDRIRGDKGVLWAEYGTVSGRPRRCGWWDSVLARYALRINGTQEIHLMKMDCLAGISPIKICVAYEVDGERFVNLPMGLHNLERYRPIYEEMEGWGDIRNVRVYSELPSPARKYIQRIAQLTGKPVTLISHGPGRGEVIIK